MIPEAPFDRNPRKGSVFSGHAVTYMSLFPSEADAAALTTVDEIRRWYELQDDAWDDAWAALHELIGQPNPCRAAGRSPAGELHADEGGRGGY